MNRTIDLDPGASPASRGLARHAPGGSPSLANGLRRDGTASDDEQPGAGWFPFPGSLSQISVGNTNWVWGVDSQSQVYELVIMGGPFSLVVDSTLASVSAANDGTVWGLNDGIAYLYAGTPYQPNGNNVWVPMQGGTLSTALSMVAVGSADQVWALGTDSRVYQWNGGGWASRPGRLTCISVGADGEVWGVDGTITNSSNVYRWNGSGWTPMAGPPMSQVSVGAAWMTFAMDADSNLYRWESGSWTPFAGPDTPNPLGNVSAATDGSLMAVDVASNVYTALCFS